MSELLPDDSDSADRDWKKITVVGLSAIGMLGLAYKLVSDRRTAELNQEQPPLETPPKAID